MCRTESSGTWFDKHHRRIILRTAVADAHGVNAFRHVKRSAVLRMLDGLFYMSQAEPVGPNLDAKTKAWRREAD